MIKLLFVVPCLNEQDSISKIIQEIFEFSKIHKEFNFALIFVDDGSDDDTWNQIKLQKKLFENNHFQITGFKLFRNFGKDIAQATAISHNKMDFDYCVFIDGDGQFDLEAVFINPKIFELQEIFIGKRQSYNRRLSTRLGLIFLRALLYVTGQYRDFNLSDFIVIPKRFLDLIKTNKDFSNISILDIILRNNMNYATFNFDIRNRVDGSSSTRWSLISLLKKGTNFVFTKPLIFFRRLIYIFAIYSFVVLIYGLYIGISSILSSQFNGIGSLIIIVAFGFSLLFLTIICGLYYFTNQLKSFEFHNSSRSWVVDSV